MSFVTQKDPAAIDIMAAVRQPDGEFMEAQLRGYILRKPSVVQEGGFAPSAWVDEIDRTPNPLGELSRSWGKRLRRRLPDVRLAKPPPRRGRSWKTLFDKTRPVPVKGVPVAARHIAAAALARAVAQQRHTRMRGAIQRGRAKHSRRQ